MRGELCNSWWNYAKIYEVVRANILNRENCPYMDLVLSELVSEETWMITQATLEGKKEVEYVFLANRVKIAHILVIWYNNVKAKNLAIWCLIARINLLHVLQEIR